MSKTYKQYLVHFDFGDMWVSENDIRESPNWPNELEVSIYPDNQPIIETTLENVRNAFAFDDVLERVKNNVTV